MGKRSNFERRERDYYTTPYKAVEPLLPHLAGIEFFEEPCGGDYRLAVHLIANGKACITASDIEPQDDRVHKFNAMDIRSTSADCFITNPPWPARHGRGEPTISMAKHLSDLAPTWFLLSADFAHNVYFLKLAERCVKIVSVGRVSWEENGTSGKDNCAWYLFDKNHKGQPSFHCRAA